MRIVKSATLMFLISLFAVVACKKDEPVNKDEDKKEDPKSTITVTTLSVSDITSTSAASGGVITVTGAATIIEAGICWSLDTEPTVLDNFLVNESAKGAYDNSNKSFESLIADLEPNTSYYIRAYAKVNDSITYGNEITFVTNVVDGIVQSWNLGEVLKTGNLLIYYDPEHKTLLFSDQNVSGNWGVMKFYNNIEYAKEYILVSDTVTLEENQAAMSMMVNDVQWRTDLSTESRILTKEVNGRIVVEFKDVLMKSVPENRNEQASGTFVLP